ncbi:MAG: hypothetical protein E6J70_05835 [Deltaproteobacteria bacterium]|nr:MAG: hypothetical protein E6J70_05835 [Deltaproteobacteria bacterium]
MPDHPIRLAAFSVLAATVVALAPPHARATQKFGPVQLSGNLQTQNLVRHPDASTYEFIQNRNTARIQFDYDWLQGGLFYNKYNIPFIESSHLFIVYRGVYDSIYDTTPGFIEKEDIHGRAYPSLKSGQFLDVFDYARTVGVPNAAGGHTKLTHDQLSLSGLTHGQREALKFDNQLREAYADIKFRTIPLTIRAGRQQIVWGETDNFRMLDRANTLDLTWHFVQEIPAPAFGWDQIRRPMWMFKFLYDLGDIWKLSQNFLEWYWNPGDWFPAKQAFLPRPWGLRFYDPLTNLVDGAFFDGLCFTFSRMNGTKLFEHGHYSRNPLENSQFGIRYHAMSPFGLEFTLNYLYQRWGGDDGTNYAPIRALAKNDVNNARAVKLYTQGIFPAEFIAPYIHTLGLSANYSDETYTQTVFRAETVYDVGIPFFDLGKITVIDVPAVPGVTKKNMWKGMIGFDRPTWIKTVNKKSTILLTGQFFWHYLVNNPGCNAGEVAKLPPDERAKLGSCLAGGLDLPSTVRTPTNTPVFRDKIRDWEALATFAAISFYRGGSIIPVLGLAVDPVNQFSMEPFWTVDYVVRDDFVVNVAQRYFVAPRGHHTPIFETWGLGGLNAGRSETSLRLTYQF